MVAKSKFDDGKGDTNVFTKEENPVCCHYEDIHGYDDYHSDFECCKNGSSFHSGGWCSMMSRQEDIVGWQDRMQETR